MVRYLIKGEALLGFHYINEGSYVWSTFIGQLLFLCLLLLLLA